MPSTEKRDSEKRDFPWYDKLSERYVPIFRKLSGKDLEAVVGNVLVVAFANPDEQTARTLLHQIEFMATRKEREDGGNQAREEKAKSR